MNVYYVTLVRSLTGYCVKFVAPSDDIVRQHVSLYYGRLWCSVYSHKPSEKCINENNPILLEEVEWE